MRKILYFCFFLILMFPSGSGFVLGQEKPNIIFFIADDVDKYQIACFGGNVYTPNLDSLASQGAIFNKAYVSSTVCTPSRYSLTTGRYPGRSHFAEYLKDYPLGSQGLPGFNVGLENDFRNVGYALQSKGYETGWVGKFHIGEDETLNGLTNAEKNTLSNASADDPVATELFRKEEIAFREYILNKGFSWAKNIYPGNLEDPFNQHNLEWSIEAALEFIDSAGDKPFYLHLNTTLLHGPDGSWEQSLGFPNYTGEGLIDRELQTGMPLRSTINERINANGYNLADNPSGITWMDDGVGALMRKLDSLGISENTMFVFLPDHGSANKASLFNKDGTNIPMIVRYPAEIPAGTRCNSLVGSARAVMTEDYKYTAVRYPKDRINDILNIKEEDLKTKLMKKLIYLTGHLGISIRGIRYSPEHLSPDQLYKLSDDPDEMNNLAEHPDYQDVLNEMKGILTGYLSSFEGRPFGEFVPGTNASPPDPVVVSYIRNIQHALRNGASLDKGTIICEGNCVTSPVSANGISVQSPGSIVSRISQNQHSCSIALSVDAEDIRVYDLSGRMILSGVGGPGNDFEIDKNSLPGGLYLLSVKYQGSLKTWKILLWE